jgi:hypothetical protein
MSEETFRQHLRAARPVGCLPATLVALGMGFVVFLGDTMGDCSPGPGCHDHDGLNILNDFAWTLAIAVSIGAASWLLSGTVRMIVRPLIGAVATIVVLVAISLLIAWLGFDPAMELLLKIIASTAH